MRFVNRACNSGLAGIKDDIAYDTGRCRFVVGCKEECESLQWALLVTMEADLAFAQSVMDVINGFNELERQATRAAIVADTRLHCIIPLYDMLYTDRDGELWYFDEKGNLTHTLRSRLGGLTGVRTRDIFLLSYYGPRLQGA